MAAFSPPTLSFCTIMCGMSVFSSAQLAPSFQPTLSGSFLLHSIKHVFPLSPPSAISHLLPSPFLVCRLPPTLPLRVPLPVCVPYFSPHTCMFDLIPLLRLVLLIDSRQKGLKIPRPRWGYSNCNFLNKTKQIPTAQSSSSQCYLPPRDSVWVCSHPFISSDPHSVPESSPVVPNGLQNVMTIIWLLEVPVS